jgi:hypothetical protein
LFNWQRISRSDGMFRAQMNFFRIAAFDDDFVHDCGLIAMIAVHF